jgi:hypothetical protein
VFARLARSVARANGMPTTRQAFVPQPVVGRSAQELRAYVDGDDAVEGGPFMQRVIEGLTNPLEDTDLSGLSFDRSAPALLEPDTEDALRARFEEERWTDFLPIVLPTEERVQAMLAGTSHAPDEVVGRMRPTAFREFWEFTVEKVAVNAVMAGARPEYLPVILAAMAGGMTARSSSTTSFAVLAMVNGPIREEIGMNAGIGAFGPYNHANATIGRAFAIASQNLQGGSTPGETYMGSQGNSYGYSACFPENEERSPYTPFHVQHGFDASASTVTTFLGGWYTQFGTVRDDAWREHFQRQLTACDPFIGPIVALDPLAANKLVEYGFDTRESLAEYLSECSALPAREYWDNQWMQTLVKPWAILGREPYATYLKAAPDEPVRAFRPEDIHVAVVGGETGGTYKMIGGALRDSITSVDDWR